MKETYGKQVSKALEFLNGNYAPVLRELKEKMLFRKWQIHPVGSKGQIKEKHLFQYSPYWH